MTQAPDFSIVTVSVPDRTRAEAIARALIEAKLAACVQIMPIDSVFRWNDAVDTATEILLLAKIRTTDFTAVEAAIRQWHSYEVPEIVAVPIIAGSAGYLDWMAGATAR